MISRDLMCKTPAFANGHRPPRFESDFAEDVLRSWRSRGLLDGASVDDFFGLDPRENLPVNWSCIGRRIVADSPAAMEPFRRGYDPADPVRLPGDWSDRLERWRGRAFALRASPWDEGLLQVIGIGDWSSFSRAVMLMHENPERIEAMVAHYADFLVALLDRVLGEVDVDYAVLYEVIASNRALVIPPAMYARFALPALRRVVACLERHGVATRVVWTTGRVGPLIPLWLDAGVNGMILTQTAASGIDYPGLRREYGRQLGLLGGLDWQTVMRGPAAIDEMLRRVARPLLEQGGYIPHLDDRVRSYMPFENYRYFRRRLNKLIDDIHGDR